ncbi:hypothetical protein [Ignicoccus hospitalis]|uniref:Uncharacterized protein n=1 Tax=Ignicoccus hospitalis (strain KIN4/I / DSM 18386 / JCM 14125) TaxID=453591 RepID=A8A8G0_IGNH4|nr:hypothetical protein [Ignicoccus hospitalis]ABU81212.1 hypothetical protein Igni_0028 [Ignicoccus hospitalis KIN4/I]HIH90642.1 hypothetical protein [Desulfurococcaceae archaeon]
MERVRDALVREVVGKKVVNDKLYKYTYYTLPLNIYIPKHVVHKYGREYIVIINSETGEIRAMPKALYEQKRNKQRVQEE